MLHHDDANEDPSPESSHTTASAKELETERDGPKGR